MQRPFPAYRGNDPYVFVSYAHADARSVYPELHSLREAGANVWYDEGISPGSRWTDDLAERIANAALVVLFVTPSSARSENCRNEIEYAIDQQRRILLVYLKPAELPGGMKLALSGRQAILKEEHSADAYRQKFLEAVAGLMGAEMTVSSTVQGGRRRRRATVAAVTLTVISIGVAGWLFRDAVPGQTGLARQEPLTLLVADFRNETGEALFDGVLEEALKVGMEGAPFITSFPRDQALRVLASLGSEKSLTHDNARLVAMREGLEMVLVGRVLKQQRGYQINVDGLHPLNGKVEISASQSAASPLETLTAIAAVAGELRQKLGDVRKIDDHLEEMFTATSLEAASSYAAGQALAADWKHAEAVDFYERAASLDAGFGRAYGGWAYSTYVLGQTQESEALWDKCIALLHTMTERERLRTLGIYYVTITGNLEKAIETYRDLVERFPADAAAHNNLAVALFTNGRFEQARDAGASLLEIYPNSLLYTANYALYNMYVADLQEAVNYARQTLSKDPAYYPALLPLAMAASLELDYAESARLYDEMAAAGAQGASLADFGRVDLALARGAYADAQAILESSITTDSTAGNRTSAVSKKLWLIRAGLELGGLQDVRTSLGRLEQELSSDRHEFEFAELSLSVGDSDAARRAADRLSRRVPAISRAYGEVVKARLALAEFRYPAAIDALRESIGLRDHWLARLYLGIAYLEAGYQVEALEELDLAWRRRGEALAVFLDDVPSFHRLVELQYWRGRAQEAMGRVVDAEKSYYEFLRGRDQAPKNAEVRDAADRLAALRNSVVPTAVSQ